MSGADPTTSGAPATGAGVVWSTTLAGPASVFSAPASIRGLPAAGRKSRWSYERYSTRRSRSGVVPYDTSSRLMLWSVTPGSP